jgi:hypothetical protein
MRRMTFVGVEFPELDMRVRTPNAVVGSTGLGAARNGVVPGLPLHPAAGVGRGRIVLG